MSTMRPGGSHDPAAEPAAPPITVRIKDACRMTGIGRSKLYELIAEGEIEIVKVGAMRLIPIATLERFVDRRRRRLNGG